MMTLRHTGSNSIRNDIAVCVDAGQVDVWAVAGGQYGIVATFSNTADAAKYVWSNFRLNKR